MDVQAWLVTLCEELARLLMALLAVMALNMLLLWGVQAAWGLYSGTSIGQRMLGQTDVWQTQIQSLSLMPSFDYALQVSLLVGVIILPVAFLLHFFHIRHLLYTPMPWLVKGAWVLLAAYVISDVLQQEVAHIDAQLAYISVLPALFCLLPVCFTVASNLLPDLASCVVRILSWFRD
ncbi:MAG: hypothetical protein Q9M19_07245 [Mariprofundaceae bacterium]|nr:hypothetical protein [Mariprofundaceae bacterium]